MNRFKNSSFHQMIARRVGYGTLSDDSTSRHDVSISSPDDDPKIHTKKEKLEKKDVKMILFFVFANFFYIISDQKCPINDPTICAKEFILPHLARWAVQIIISAVLFTIIICKGIRRETSRFYSLGAVLNIFYLCFFFNPVLNAQSYGQMFGFFLALCMIICLLTVGIATASLEFYRAKPKTLIGLSVTIVVLLTVSYINAVKTSCRDWRKGLDGEEILVGGDTCTVEEPSTCIYEMTSGLLDLARFKSCANFKPLKSVMEEYFWGGPIIGFPRTDKFTYEERMNLQKAILDHTVSLDSMDDPAGEGMEVFLDKTSESNPTLRINLKKNQDLIDERAKINHKGLSKNVLVIYIDTLSRANSMRKLKKTMSWFDARMNKKNPDVEAFQFFKYHTLAPYTFTNLYEALFGKHPDDPSLSAENPAISYIQTFKDNGYITGHVTDYCGVSLLDLTMKDPVRDIPYDHENLVFACDPHYHDPTSPYGIFTGPYSVTRKCLYKKDVFEYVYEYGNQFWRTYQDEKKLLYLEFTDAHEGTGELIRHMDDALSEFINGLEGDNLLEDTTVIMYADHGLHMQGLFQLMGFDQVITEVSLPALFTVFPKKIAEKHRTDIKANQQSIVSAHQIHNLFLTLAEGEKSQFLNDSLIGPLTAHRGCQDIGVRDAKCVCTF